MKEKLIALKNRYFPPDTSYSLKEQLGYCSGIYGNCMGQDTVSEFSDDFSRTYMGISDGHMHLYGNIALSIGLLTSLLSGYILDIPAKPGKKAPAKIITGIMPIPFAITSMLLFVVPRFGNEFRIFLWMMICHLIFNIADNFYDASLNTLSLRITNDPSERKTFYTVGTFASSLGSMLPGWIIPIVQDNVKSGIASEKRSYFIVALIFCILGVLMMYGPFFTMEEHVRVTEKKEKEKLAWDRQTVGAILHNRTFIVVELATMFEQIRQLSYSMFNYFYRDILKKYSLYSIMGSLSGALSYCGLFAMPFLTEHLTARAVASGGFAYTGVFYSAIALLGWSASRDFRQKHALLFGLLVAFSGMPNNAIAAAKKILVGDSIDYMEWYSEKKYGRSIHAEGFICATQSFLGNVFNFLRTNLFNIFFKLADYQRPFTNSQGVQQRPVQSTQTLNVLFRMFVLFSVIGNFSASITYLFDNYHGKKKEAISVELAQMRERRAAVDKAAEYALADENT